MDPILKQSLFDSALRSQFAWRRKAAQLLNSGMLILQKAADARPAAEELLNRKEKRFTAAESAPLEEFYLYDVGLFLVALAIENLLKGLWVGRNFKQIKNIRNLRKDLHELATHDLEKVADATDIWLSSDERRLLADLSKIIVWYGRYSTPMKADTYGELLESAVPSGRFMTGRTIFTMDLPFPAEIDHFISRLLKELETIPNDNHT
jgi:hypothetical protein